MTTKRFILILVAALSLQAAEPEKYWFFFTDKNTENATASLRKAQTLLSERSLQRRAKINPTATVDELDVPVSSEYVKMLTHIGIHPIRTSKWLNAVSAAATPDQRALASALECIQHVQPVATLKRDLPNETLLKSNNATSTAALDYGASLTQNELINVPNVHALELDGSGVLIGVFDSGFFLDHEALRHLDIQATYDFVQNDNIVSNQDGDPSTQHNHGTSVLSACGGYAPGTLIGPAYNASYVLAKTEDLRSETQIEEDNWIAAAEWADSIGVDIITTSVGYLDWYETSDIDGKTAPITIAADIAVNKGIVVISSAGNEGNGSWQYVTPPADGLKVLAVGAVDSDGTLSYFSSLGPTADGRIKPDVMAQGTMVTLARPVGYSNSSQGTSYAAPQVAGVAALVLQAHPGLIPTQVNTALKMTADNASTPNNEFGWGLIDALAAVNFYGSVIDIPDETQFVTVYPNPYFPNRQAPISFKLDLTDNLDIRLDIYNILGQHVYQEKLKLGPGTGLPITWNGEMKSGYLAPSGIYIFQVRLGDKVSSGKFTVLN